MNLDNLPILLMTAAIDPRGCGMYSPKEREKQYRHSLAYICRRLKTSGDLFSKVVFFDNSGWDLSALKQSIPESLRSHFVFLSFSPSDFDPSRGKSYNEMLAIDKIMSMTESFSNSRDPLFLKVTGRFPVLNIRRLSLGMMNTPWTIQFCCSPIIAHVNSRLFHPIPWIDARCFAFRKSIWCSRFKGLYKNNIPGKIAIENQLHLAYKDNLENQGWNRFRIPPLIVGKQGHTVFYHGILFPKWIEPIALIYLWFLDCCFNIVRRRSEAAMIPS